MTNNLMFVVFFIYQCTFFLISRLIDPNNVIVVLLFGTVLIWVLPLVVIWITPFTKIKNKHDVILVSKIVLSCNVILFILGLTMICYIKP